MTDYTAVIRDLEQRRDEIGVAIRALQALQGVTAEAPTPEAKKGTKRVVRTCKLCRLEGHNAKTCPTTKPNGKIAELYRRCPECHQKTPAKGSCNHCQAKAPAA